jgi:hypothetical protein
MQYSLKPPSLRAAIRAQAESPAEFPTSRKRLASLSHHITSHVALDSCCCHAQTQVLLTLGILAQL